MKNRRTILLIVAGILALGAGLLTFDYLSAANKHVAAAPPRDVVVALAAIPARMPITPNMISVVSRPSNDVEPDAMSSIAQTSGDVSLANIPAGATITESNTSRLSDVSLASRLAPGMRAVSIPVDDVKDVSGLLQPGDHVDVIAIPPRVSNAQPMAYTILRNIKVLALGGLVTVQVATPAPGQGVSEPADARTATLEVSPRQADILAMADINTVLRLALRNPHEATNSTPAEELVFQTTPSAAQGSAPSRRDPPAALKGPSAPLLSRVVVIDGDEILGQASHEAQR